ncbi:MAG: hypothetical protein P1S46_06130 [bacterium]|nr:hypothetical protein [bacterium]
MSDTDQARPDIRLPHPRNVMVSLRHDLYHSGVCKEACPVLRRLEELEKSMDLVVLYLPAGHERALFK